MPFDRGEGVLTHSAAATDLRELAYCIALHAEDGEAMRRRGLLTDRRPQADGRGAIGWLREPSLMR